jgi:uncharacterized protein (DUF924 family)/Ca2+-binding EF-hand superfamily protein
VCSSDLPNPAKCSDLWFKKSASIDRDIRERYSKYIEKAINGEYNHWLKFPNACVALMILVDQFPRNIYRDTSKMFAGNNVAVKIVQQNHDWQSYLSPVHQLFSPGLILTHQENPDFQKQIVKHYSEIEDQLPEGFYGFKSIFVKHLDVIEKFGRFPHRNDVLNRTSTEKETAFMLDPTYRFDLAAHIDPKTGKMKFGREPNSLWQMFQDELTASSQFDALLKSDITQLNKGKVSQIHLDEYHLLFGQLDVSGDGFLEASELKVLFDSSGKNYSNEKLNHLVQHLSKHRSKGLSFAQFVSIMETDFGENAIHPSIDDFFDMFNTDGDEKITTEELYSCIHAINPRITNPEIQEMLETADTDGDGIIDRNEFQQLIINLHT